MSFEKVALVTAGSAGLGACIARTLACNGHMRVIVNYSNNVSRADKLVEHLESLVKDRIDHSNRSTPRFVAIQADMGDQASVKRLVQEARQKMGRLDVVVSNAGWTQMRNFMDLDDGVDEEDWDRCFRVNVKSHLWLFHAAKPFLDETEGSFITTASVAGVKPSGSSLVRVFEDNRPGHLADFV